MESELDLKWIPSFEGFYDIDNVGNVRRHFKNGNITRIKPRSKKGIDTVKLCINSVYYVKTIHILLYELYGIPHELVDSKKNDEQGIECKCRLEFKEMDLPAKGAWKELKQTELYKQLNNKL